MAKRKFKLTEAERKELLRGYQAGKDAGTRTRYQAVRLYGEGYAEKEIEQIIRKDWLIMSWWQQRQLSKLQIEELQEKLHQYTPKELYGANASTVDGQFWTIEDLSHMVRERYGVEYKSRTSYTSLLRLCGFSYQKTEKVFKSRSQTKVADFEEQFEKN